MRLLFVTQYGESAASSRTRVFQYIPYLKEHGHHCRILSVVKDQNILGSQLSVETNPFRKMFYYIFVAWRTLFSGVQVVSHGRNSDVIFIQKVVFPALLRWAIKRLRAVVIFDFDDAIFTTEVQERNWLARYKLHRNEIGVPAMLKISKLAIVENEYNASFAKDYVSNIGIITGPIDTLNYNRGQEKMPTRDDSRVVLGWIGSATTLPYLLEICEILEKIGREYSNVCLNVIGATKIHLREMEVISHSWSIETEVDKLMKFDIGLMPVPDNAWTKGKGGYKLLQYMSMGLPVIASPVGINRDIVSHGQDGFLASDRKEWEDFLRILIEDRMLRECMGERGRKKIEDKYSLQRSQSYLEELIIQTAVN